MNMKIIENGLRERTILVTGAAGSIGSEIVRQLTRFRIGKLILVDNAETPMFHLESELQDCFSHAPVRTILGDVTDPIKMDRIFKESKPEIVFHAAAYKHVPLMEENPHEAIRVNVGSTALLTKLSIEYKVRKFVMVSTDKAVNPTNVMGASKRMCEMLIQSRSLTPGNRTSFVITRFGNVLGSNGSVIPIFKRQIEEGGPVTVTHPEITRFFMTIPEACQLVLEAGFMGLGGEVFVFDMGEPVKIADMARRMIRLSGYEPDKDVKIEFTGLRPGEKLYEELLADKEKTLPTYNPKVKVAEVAWLDYRDILIRIHRLLRAYPSMDEKQIVRNMKSIVPEFESSNEFYSDDALYSANAEYDLTHD
jgi:FlaA1/EpsC-like NDP-sugar epimerase